MERLNTLKKPKLLIVGTFHMGPTTDMFGSEIDDLKSEKRQQEILEVVNHLKSFKPTKVALEIETNQNKKINEQYERYQAGNFQLNVNEVHQIGFRIASDLLHEQVYCIDWMEKGVGTRSVGDVYEYARENQPDLFNSLFGWLNSSSNTDHSDQSYKTILDMYRDCNEITGVKKHHTMNINIARIGEIDHYVGMEWLIWWYQRNLIIYSNLCRIANSDQDRILLIIGSGHVQILLQFLNESGFFEIETINKYL